MNFGIEDETLEFKKSTGELNEAMNSVCAMLNKHGRGTVYFGILPNGIVRGQEVNESTLRDISRKVYECIEPQVIPTVEKKIVDGKEIVELTVRGNNKPYSSKGVYYIRTADEDKVLPPHELRQLFEYNRETSWDKELTEYTVADIDYETFKKYYDRAIACGRLHEEKLDIEKILRKLGLIKNDKLTNAAYYLFSKNKPIVLKMAVFATPEKLTFVDINRTNGNIIELIDRAMEYIKEHINWKAEISGDGRTEIPEIPLKALREIICNSFAHARYNSSTEHEIDIHPDKVKIYNPGEFPIGYTPEDFANEDLESMVRNPLILKALYLSSDVESYSSGFKRVYNECNNYNVKVSYKMSNEGFAFIFYREYYLKMSNLTSDEQKVYDLVKENPKLTLEEIGDIIDKSSRTVQRIFNSLKERKLIERIDSNKSGSWKVL